MVFLESKVFAQLHLVHQLQPFLNQKIFQADIHGPRLDYSNMLYMELSLKTTQKLQLVQNAATWATIGTLWCAYVFTLLHKLPWLSVYFQVWFAVLVATYAALDGIRPGYLRDFLFPWITAWPIQSDRIGMLQVLLIKHCQLSTPDNYAFSVTAPPLWNRLPFGIQVTFTLWHSRGSQKLALGKCDCSPLLGV